MTATATCATRRTSPGSGARRCATPSRRRSSCPVFVDNDANAAAQGELVHGAARGARYALVITLGTGHRRRDHRPRSGHPRCARLCRRDRALPDRSRTARCARAASAGHWEAFASGSALGPHGPRAGARSAGRRRSSSSPSGDPDAVTGVHVGDAAQAGDADALDIVAEYAGLRRGRARRAGQHPRSRSASSSRAVSSSWATRSSRPLRAAFDRSARGDRVPAPRSTSCPPSSASTPA